MRGRVTTEKREVVCGFGCEGERKGKGKRKISEKEREGTSTNNIVILQVKYTHCNKE